MDWDMSGLCAMGLHLLDRRTKEALLSLAAETDVLFIGENHGTQEVPALVSSLLESLWDVGYRVLGLEVPISAHDLLAQWASGTITEAPEFFASGGGDGRGNRQALLLIRRATEAGWRVVCFDVAVETVNEDWSQRDREMATNLLAQWHRQSAQEKAMCVCGNLHSRLANLREELASYWPSFAAEVQRLRPELRAGSVNIVFHTGGFYNFGVKHFADEPLAQAYMTMQDGLGHTAALHLPTATPATFV